MYKNVSIVCKKGNKKTYQGLERHLPCLEPLPSVSSLCGITCRDGWKEARYKYWNISIVCIKKTKTKCTLGLETRLEPLLSFQSSCGITRRGGWKEVRYNYRNISIVCKKQKENIPIGSSPSTRCTLFHRITNYTRAHTCTHVFPKADNNLIFEASHEGEPIENTHTHTLSTCRSAASIFKSNQSSELETDAF